MTFRAKPVQLKMMRILWLKTELLHPVDKGGRIRTYHMLKELKREHQITYLTLDDGTAAPDARARATEYCHELVVVPHQTRTKFTPGFYLDLTRNLLTRLPYFIMKYESPEMRKEIEQLTARTNFDVVVCDFLMPSVNLPAQLPCPTVLFQHNVEAMIWKRHYQVQQNPLKKLYLYGQWRKAFNFERIMAQSFDHVVAVSREDAETMQADYGISVSDVPTGVDTDYFTSGDRSQQAQRNLVFTGSMDWLPNHDAIQFFVRDILPLIRKALPDVSLTVVGRNPYPELIDLSKREPGITVTGRVDDVRPYMERATAYIVPIRIGGGTRLKIYEAMAMDRPVISTTIGAEGLPVENERELLLADSPDAFAAAVVRVLSDESLANSLSVRAGKLVREQFGWNKAAQRFADVCAGVTVKPLAAKMIRPEENLQAV